MTLNTDKALNFIEAIATLSESLGMQRTSRWIQDLRHQGISRLNQIGLPSLKDEDWKYANLRPIIERSFQLPLEGQLQKVDSLHPYADSADLNVVFINGRLSLEFSHFENLPAGVTVIPFSHLKEARADSLKELFEQHYKNGDPSFIALNKSLTQEGVVIDFAPKSALNRLIHIIHVVSTDQEDMIISPRTIIVLGESSQAVVLESHIAFNNDHRYFTNALTDIFLQKNATIHYCKAQGESLKAYHMGTTRIWQDRDSNFHGFSLMTGAAWTRNNLDIIVEGEGSSTFINGLYCLNGTQFADNHTSVDHRIPHCTSNQLYKGIMNGSSHAVFNGKIFVRPAAQQTNSYQLNKNMILGRNCHVDTKPQLEIFADDVKCTHGATIGQLNEDELFYMQSRSIAKKEAIKMLAKGYVDDIINTIARPSIEKKLYWLLQPTFASL